ncbi:hypothetical protein Leryth_021029 [Lithospermum erythrorhizon]|nr:hypothetical protein Leryth_021029 [Lithospermum erythrorhizon]
MDRKENYSVFIYWNSGEIYEIPLDIDVYTQLPFCLRRYLRRRVSNRITGPNVNEVARISLHSMTTLSEAEVRVDAPPCIFNDVDDDDINRPHLMLRENKEKPFIRHDQFSFHYFSLPIFFSISSSEN